MAALRKDSEDAAGTAKPAPGAGAEDARFDAESLRKALKGAGDEGGDAPGSVRSMHERAEMAFSEARAPGPSGPETVADLAVEPEIVQAWSLRRQLAFIVLASAACWAAVLAPLLLIF